MHDWKISHGSMDPSRRRLLVATTAAGSVAAIGSAIPFVANLSPSERARAAGAPVEANVSKLAPGELMTVEWRGKPVWILHRSAEMIERVNASVPMLSDPQSLKSHQPEYSKNPLRSRKPEYFVAVGICTHLGCVPVFRKEVAASDIGADWLGGFYCPCHGSKFDLAGRVYKNVPAPVNLEIPSHQYLSESVLLIGVDDTA